jgi:hypothetical protein
LSEDDRTVPQIDAEISHYQGKIDAITEAREPNVPESKPTIFDHSGDAKLTSEMGKIFDKSTGKAQLADEQKTVPSITPATSLDDAFEKTAEHIYSSKEQRATVADAHKLVEQVRDRAARFGVKLDDAQAMEAAMKLEETLAQEAKAQAADPWQPAAQEISQHYPGQAPHEIARGYAQLETRLRADPVAGVAEIANGIGMHPLQLAQNIFQRYGQQQNQPTQQDVNRLYGIVEQAYSQNPRMAELEQDVLDELGATKRSGDPAADLHRAVQKAEAKNRKRSTSDRMDRSMNAAYDRAAGRKR